jgi:branched-chain amino acid transport system substrate-binding protein
LGYVGDLTGVCSSTYADGPGGAEARVDLQNAQGGVDGHPIKLVVQDTTCTPTGEALAVELLISKHVTGIITATSFSSAGVKLEYNAGIPESATCACSAQYSQLPYTNLFSYNGIGSPTVFNGLTYTNTVIAQFLKDVGVTKLAGFGYGIAPASFDTVKEIFAASKTINGPTECYTNYSVPFGGVDFTADGLALKAANCNGVTAAFVESSDVALAEEVKTQEIQATQLYFTGYDEDVANNPQARASFQNVYAAQGGPNFTTPNAATQSMVATLKQYDSKYSGGIPDFGLWGSYIATDLMIKGLELAGPNPTSASVISNLRNLDSYNGEGTLPTTVSLQHFGTPAMIPKTQCEYFMQLVGSQFVVYKGQPICGSPLGVPGLTGG